MSATDWTALEDALRAWLLAGAGVPEVVIGTPNAHRPPLPYGHVTLGSDVPDGQAHVADREVAGAPAGTEVEISHLRLAELSVQVEVFTKETDGPSSARARLTQARATLELDEHREAIRAAGASVLEAGPVLSIATLIDPSAEGRATLEVRLHVSAVAAERTTWIEVVNAGVNVTQ